MKKLLLILIAMLMTGSLFAETVELEESNPIGYPQVVTPFRLYDDIGDEIRDESQTIIVEETVKGTPVLRDVVGIDCPSLDKTSFSAILVIDISTSMDKKIAAGLTRIDVLKDGIKDFADKFDPLRTEIAIVTFCSDAIGRLPNYDEPILPFTNDRDEVKYAIDNHIPPLCPGTNYNAAFLHKNAPYDWIEDLSALYYCQSHIAKWKPNIIFLTDGNHVAKGQVEEFEIGEVVQKANEYNATVYVIKIGDEELSQQNRFYLEQLALIGKVAEDTSPNIWLDVNSKNELGNIFQEILTEAGTMGTPPPCYVTWETDCEGGESASFTFPDYGGISDSHEYTLDDNKKPHLSNDSNDTLLFKDVVSGSSDFITINLKAEKNDVEITNFLIKPTVRGEGRYEISDWGPKRPLPFAVAKDEEFNIIVRYTPSDSLFSQAVIELEGTACTGREMTISGEMMPYAEDVDMGFVDIGSSRQKTITKLICNKTGGMFSINGISITSEDRDDFDVISSGTPFELDSGDCAELTFEFTPTEPAGPKKATLIIETDYNGGTNFESIIRGNDSLETDVQENKLYDFGESKIQVFPNPSNDIINVRIPEGINISTQPLVITIYDYMGRELKKLTVNNINEEIKININDLRMGTYFVKCNNTYINEIIPFVVFK